MATTAITPEELTLNTPSANLIDTGGGSGNGIVPTAAADGWLISGVQSEDRLLLKIYAGATETITVKAGNRPPSQRADLGDLTFAMTSGHAKFVCIEAARFMKTAGTIQVTCLSTSSVMEAVLLPNYSQRT